MRNNMVGCYNLIEYDDKILLVKESRRPGSFCWALPAGKLEVGETFIACAQREAMEEAGVAAMPTALLGIYQTPELLGNNVINIGFISLVDDMSTAFESARLFSKEDIDNLRKQSLLRDFIVDRMIQDYFSGKQAELSLLNTLPFN